MCLATDGQLENDETVAFPTERETLVDLKCVVSLALACVALPF